MEITIVISSAVLSAAISLIGVVASALITKSSATKTAKITAQNEIKKMKMEMEHADRIRSEDVAAQKRQATIKARQAVAATVSAFREMPDVNTKQAAVEAVNNLMLIVDEPSNSLRQLTALIQDSDPFVGPESAELRELVERVISERSSTE